MSSRIMGCKAQAQSLSTAFFVPKHYFLKHCSPFPIATHTIRHHAVQNYCPRRPVPPCCAASAGNSYVGGLIGSGLKFAVVVGRFNNLVTKLLLEGALEHFERHGVPQSDVDVAWVPGSFELPVVAKAMAKSGKYDAVVAIGVVVRGATAHYDAVVGGATSGVLNASTDSGVPVIFGVLTCDTMDQALDRAGGKVGNKGGEAAVTAIETANLLKELRGLGKAAQPW